MYSYNGMVRGMDNSTEQKLTVEFREGVTETAPIIPRRYTYIQKPDTEEAKLVVAPEFDFDIAKEGQEEILGEWLLADSGTWFYVYLDMVDRNGQELSKGQQIEREHLLLHALVSIREGDAKFFEVHPELLNYPIIVYYLYPNSDKNYEECWGTFANYDITVSELLINSQSTEDYHILIDQKWGDLTGDGTLEKVSIFGDYSSDFNKYSNIILQIDTGSEQSEVIMELNGNNPSLFLGDFTKNHRSEVLLRADRFMNSMISQDQGEVGASIEEFSDEGINTIFTNDQYNLQYRFYVEFVDGFKVRIVTVKEEKIFFLDISYLGMSYLSQYYKENGELKKPVQGVVQKAEAFLPIVTNTKEGYYDLLVIHRIVESQSKELLGYIENWLSWEHEQFVSVRMVAATPGRSLV